MLTSASALLFGLLLRNEVSVIVAAVVYASLGIVGLYQTYRHAKAYRHTNVSPEKMCKSEKLKHIEKEEQTYAEKITEWIGGAITFTGLFLVIASKDNGMSGYGIGGWIIWGGAIFCYFLSGIIMREVGGIPLSMGYGGWKVRFTRNGRLIR